MHAQDKNKPKKNKKKTKNRRLDLSRIKKSYPFTRACRHFKVIVIKSTLQDVRFTEIIMCRVLILIKKSSHKK